MNDIKTQRRTGKYRWSEPTKLGYQDAIDGFDFHPNYDSWNCIDQINYELSRLRVKNILAAGLEVPPIGEFHQPKTKPSIYSLSFRLSVKRIGAPFNLAALQ